MTAIAACGSSSGGGGGGGKKGGSIKIGSVLPDKYDPVLYQTLQAYQANQLVYTGLSTFKHVQGSAGGETIPALAESLPKLEAEAAAIRTAAGVDRLRLEGAVALRDGESRLSALRTQEVELGSAIAAGLRRLADLRAGKLDDPRIHLHHAAVPEPPSVTERRAFGEAWAALSVGLLIAALAVIVWFRILPAPLALVALLASYLAIESFFDKHIVELVLRITVILAIVCAVILAVTFLRELLLVGLLALGVLLIADNIGEIRRRLS
jgi:hypothetical protein